ncbi:MAG: ABC transporter substrate-binding protein [Desulfobacterales bacterium]|nr:ABC transporter substrate-binding protein [Desulfobacterales bacterium]
MNSIRTCFLLVSAALFILLGAGLQAPANAVDFVQSPPLAEVIKTGVGDVKEGAYINAPLITWGGDIATILANGGSETTTPNSIFGQKGLKIKLHRQDIFKNQVEAYLKGESPFLRGTMGMINMAANALAGDPRTRPVIIYQMTWSNGGDCLVVKKGIRTAGDLKGKTVSLQAYGPHVDYLAKTLKDAGLSMKDVRIRWTPDLTGTDNTPAEALYEPDVDAAFVIIPDGLMLTSNGAVGTGAEGSVKGAKIMMSTKTANRIISDVYAVRSDYFQANRDKVEAFTHGLMLATQELKELFKNKKSRMSEYKPILGASAKLLLDSAQAAADAEALYGDCEFVGFRGNIKFFGDAKWPRGMNRLIDEIQSAFITIGLLARKSPMAHAKWNYDDLKPGLTAVDDVEAPRFDKEAVAKVVARKQALGVLSEGELFSLEINFKPNQKAFSEDMYADGFEKVVEMAATYGGAVITVEGHSDPHKYNRLKKKGATPVVLKRTKQAAKNLSMSRSLAVRNSIIKFAENSGVPLDESQFTVVGHGISQPKYPRPKDKEEWLSNMRVVFRVIQIEAEDEAFEPLD